MLRSAVLRPLGSRSVELLAPMLLLAAGARAEPEQGLSLQWAGPPDCAQPEELGQQVAALLPPGSALARERTFDVEIETLPAGGFRLEVREPSAGVASVRVLGSCAEAREAAVVLIAMALDARALPPEPDPVPAERPAEEPAPREEEEVPAAPAPPDARGRWAVMAAALGDVRTLPEPSVGPMLGTSWSLRRVRLAWHARYLPAQPVDDPPGGARTSIDLYAAALNGAYLWSLRALALGPAVELEVGYLRGRSRDVPGSRSEGTSWAAVAGGALAELRLHPRLSLQFGALLGAPLWRSRFALEPDRLLYGVESLVFRWFLGVGLHLGPTG